MAGTRTGQHDPDEWFTVKDIATMYQLSASQIRRLIDDHQIRAVVVNAQARRPTYRVNGAALNQYELRNEAS